MSFGLQLQAPFSSPNLLIVAAVVLVIIAHACQAWYEQRKRVSEGRAPRVPYIIPWVGSALDIWRDPDAFFTRTQYVPKHHSTRCRAANMLLGGSMGMYS